VQDTTRGRAVKDFLTGDDRQGDAFTGFSELVNRASATSLSRMSG
jgi:hypothetical protein